MGQRTAERVAGYRRHRLGLALLFVGAATYFALRPPAYPPIRSDGLGYHLWLRAVARGRLDFCSERAHPKPYGHIAFAVARRSRRTGRCGVIYPPGVALTKAPLLLPFVETDEAADPNAFEQAVTSALPLVLAGLVVQAQMVLSMDAGVGVRAATFAAALAMFGTGYFHYASFDASFSHAYSAFWAISTLMARRLRRPARRRALTIVSASMLILTRNTNLLLLPLIAALHDWLPRQARSPTPPTESIRPRRVLLDTAILCLCAVPGELVQIALNYWFEGRLTLSSYSTTGALAFSVAHVVPILWSYERGLLTYYPALIVMCGAMLVTTVTRSLALLVIGVIAAYALLYSSWSNWMLGQGFGYRGFVEMVPLVAIPCAVALDRIAVPRFVALLGVIAIVWCLLLMTAYWRGAIPYGGTTPAQYWSALTGQHLSRASLLMMVAPVVAVGGLYAWRPMRADTTAW